VNGKIDISVEYRGQQLDFQVPSAVTIGRLTELLRQALGSNSQSLPLAWKLELKDKTIKMGETDRIGEFPIGSGDVFCIVAVAEERINESI
jgi:uncharacterized ubiquitin-like protein YukD